MSREVINHQHDLLGRCITRGQLRHEDRKLQPIATGSHLVDVHAHFRLDRAKDIRASCTLILIVLQQYLSRTARRQSRCRIREQGDRLLIQTNHWTLRVIWPFVDIQEYAERYGASAYRRSAFCEIYRRWEKRLKRSMRQRHFAGEKLFVDYDGRTVPIYGRSGEESFHAQLFVSAMGASGCAYAEATRTQSLPDWLASHVRALEYYGAAPTIVVPDNPKVGVTRRSLRAGVAALVRRTRRALPSRHHPSTAGQAEGQKPRRAHRAPGVSLDPRAIAPSTLLQSGRVERGDPAAADRT
jgi:hypothetical protein